MCLCKTKVTFYQNIVRIFGIEANTRQHHLTNSFFFLAKMTAATQEWGNIAILTSSI